MTASRFVTRNLIALLIGLSAPYAHAETIGFAMADGKSWNATTSDGHRMKITFFADGRAKMNVAIMSRALTWQPTKDGLCLTGVPGGNGGPKCLRLARTSTGYVGYEGGKVKMTLSR